MEEKSIIPGTLSWLATKEDCSWVKQLNADPDWEKHKPNRTSRQVLSGHYVPVEPTPLRDPYTVAYSPEMAASLGLSEEECKSDKFAAFFSGNMSVVPAFRTHWATPYALSIYGEEMYRNCPFNTGNGYGDGRAISITEVVVDQGEGPQRWELQLKGAGKTPFCRSGDGRAVLRSSVREFLVSEAMFHLGIPTTRALSLVASRTESVMRPWFSEKPREMPNLDDPRLQGYPPQLLPILISQIMMGVKEPDIMQNSTCAITCRVAPSFVRVGHIELFGRRARQTSGDTVKRKKELELIVEHLMFREYPKFVKGADDSDSTLQTRILGMLEEASQRIAKLTADWVRVGYCQGNFNSDNCLAGGRTMDYGPFGYIEKFYSLWNMWTGGGEHYGFLNQPTAGAKNFESLVTAMLPLLDKDNARKARQIVSNHEEKASDAMNEMWRDKLGLCEWSSDASILLTQLLKMMEQNEADYTLLWRQLAVVAESAEQSHEDNDKLFAPLADCFYKEVKDKTKWSTWLNQWITLLKSSGRSFKDISSHMKRTNPKFIPREWMLVRAYNTAGDGNYLLLQEVQNLLRHPYDEQDDVMTTKYFRKAPPVVYTGSGLAGTAFMT